MTITKLIQQYQTMLILSNVLFWVSMLMFAVMLYFLIISSKVQKKLKNDETVNLPHWIFNVAKSTKQTNKLVGCVVAVEILCLIGYSVASLNTSHIANKIQAQSLQTNIIEATNYSTSKAKGPDVPKDAVKYQVLNSSFIVRPDQVATKHQTLKPSTPQIAVKFATIDAGSKKNDQKVKKIIMHQLHTKNWQDVVNSTAKVTITE